MSCVFVKGDLSDRKIKNFPKCLVYIPFWDLAFTAGGRGVGCGVPSSLKDK